MDRTSDDWMICDAGDDEPSSWTVVSDAAEGGLAGLPVPSMPENFRKSPDPWCLVEEGQSPKVVRQRQGHRWRYRAVDVSTANMRGATDDHEAIGSDEEHTIAEVLRRQQRNHVIWYLIQWTGEPAPRWELEQDLFHLGHSRALRTFDAKLQIETKLLQPKRRERPEKVAPLMKKSSKSASSGSVVPDMPPVKWHQVTACRECGRQCTWGDSKCICRTETGEWRREAPTGEMYKKWVHMHDRRGVQAGGPWV
jgi:hypothetical protein